jgi:hypothetical protein
MRPLELEMNRPGDGDDRGAIGYGGGGGHRAVGGGDAMHLLPAIDLVEGHGAEDGGEDHSRGVDVDQVFVNPDAAARRLARDFGSADGVLGSRGIHANGRGAEGDIHVA